MSAGWVNATVLAGIVLIVAGFLFIRIAARRRGGHKRHGLAKPSKAQYRKVNPKSGDLFP
jgi:hypothetical protein